MILKEGDTTTSAKAFFYKEGRVLLVKPTGSEDRYDIPGVKLNLVNHLNMVYTESV